MSLVRIDRLMRRTGMSPSRIGWDAIGDKNLLQRLRRGVSMHPETVARLDAYLSEQGV